MTIPVSNTGAVMKSSQNFFNIYLNNGDKRAEYIKFSHVLLTHCEGHTSLVHPPFQAVLAASHHGYCLNVQIVIFKALIMLTFQASADN